MSNTPRTDALPRIRQAGETEYVPIDDCRQLECELDEARETIRHLQMENGLIKFYECEERNKQLSQQRDTLAEALRRYMRASENVGNSAVTYDEWRALCLAATEAENALAAVKGGKA